VTHGLIRARQLSCTHAKIPPTHYPLSAKSGAGLTKYCCDSTLAASALSYLRKLSLVPNRKVDLIGPQSKPCARLSQGTQNAWAQKRHRAAIANQDHPLLLLSGRVQYPASTSTGLGFAFGPSRSASQCSRVGLLALVQLASPQARLRICEKKPDYRPTPKQQHSQLRKRFADYTFPCASKKILSAD